MSYINKLDFDSIRPYEDHEIHEVFERLKNEESFMNLISFLYPEIQADKFMNQLSNMTSIKQFQEEVKTDPPKAEETSTEGAKKADTSNS